MAEIIKAYRQTMPAMRFIGRKYTNADRVDGHFGSLWHEWLSKGWFELIEEKAGGSLKDTYEDADALIGLMCGSANGFEYRIGRFVRNMCFGRIYIF